MFTVNWTKVKVLYGILILIFTFVIFISNFLQNLTNFMENNSDIDRVSEEQKSLNFNNNILNLDIFSPERFNDSSPSIMMIIDIHRRNQQFLTPRILCAIESAAKTHLNISVSVIMTSRSVRLTPVTRKLLNNYEYIKMAYLNATHFCRDLIGFKNLCLAMTLGLDKEEMETQFYAAGILRWLLLWKYGGIYLDTDIIVKEDLMKYENFSGLESERWVGAGALGFVPGHPLIEKCLTKIMNNYDGSVWGSAGPELLTNSLIEKCGMELPSGKLKFCPDVKIFGTKAFYPIPWWEWYSYLKEDADLTEKMMQDPDILGFHVWNFHIYKYPVPLYERSPFAVAAKKFCPVVVSEVGNQL